MDREEIYEQLRAKIQRAKGKALNEAAESLRIEVDKRIFERSRRSDGAPIGQGTTHKDGTSGVKYEKRYAKKRTNEGLQINFIDFQRKGDLRRSLTVLRSTSNSIKIVVTGSSAEVADALDKMKGKTFSPTKSEIALARKRFRDVLRTNFK